MTTPITQASERRKIRVQDSKGERIGGLELNPETVNDVTTGFPLRSVIPSLIVIPTFLGLIHFSQGSLLYASYGNPFLSAVLLSILISGFYCYQNESSGKNLKYSKFAESVSSPQSLSFNVPSKLGFTLFYFPSFLLSLAYVLTAATQFNFEAFIHLPFSVGLDGSHPDLRLSLLSALLTLHFGKRTLESHFLHNYSGFMDISAAAMIPIHYLTLTFVMLYHQSLTKFLPPPWVDLTSLGVILSLLGMAGNFYHHHILSKLRSRSESGGKVYVIPKGGLFNYVACAHYFFEILSFVGFVLVGQTVAGFVCLFFTAIYLGGRSECTLNWYRRKFEDYPKNTKALVPFIF